VNYYLKKIIGQGGMATVHLAEDPKFNTEVAVKVLNKEFVHNENIRKRFLAEARNMFRMSHPNIVKVTDLIDEEDTVAFVMECIEGETLKEYLEHRGKLSDEEIKTIFSQMLDAVGYVHEQNLVHRDIKPSNFMIDKNGKVKLMDFGIAKNTDATSAEYTQTGTGMQMGTPMYMSPEQITESKSVTAHSDIYSLGVVLWQMVTGEKPYDVKTLSNFQLQIKIVQEPLGKTNTSWDTHIQKATEKEVSKRFKNCIDFNESINQTKNKSRSRKNVTKEPLNDEKTIIEHKIIEVQKKPTDRKQKIASPNPEKSVQKEEKTSPSKTSKKWYFLLVLIPVILRAIFVNLQDSNSYSFESAFFGNQEWMTSNLNVDHFRNGDPIPEAKTNEEWEKAGENGLPAWKYYNNDPSNDKIYNWYAVNDPRGLAPEGWRIPSSDDWGVLEDYLFSQTSVVPDAYAADTTDIGGDLPPLPPAIDYSARTQDLDKTNFKSMFGNLSDDQPGDWWCSDSDSDLGYEDNAWMIWIDEDYDFSILSDFKSEGFFVRCLKN